MIITIFTILDCLLHFVVSFLKKNFNILISEIEQWLISAVYQDVKVAKGPIKILKKLLYLNFQEIPTAEINDCNQFLRLIGH